MRKLNTTPLFAAFTLVELLIVVMALAILAMIAIPQFSTASKEARESAVMADIATLRRQINLYLAEHNNRGPHLDEDGALDTAGLKARLTGKTSTSGQLSSAGVAGPYIREWPENPFATPSVAAAITFGTSISPPRDGASGWYYNTNSCIVSPNTTEGALTMDP